MSRIMGNLFQTGDAAMGRGASLFSSANDRMVQNSAFLAQLAEQRRRALREEQLQKEAIDNQKEAQDQARSDSWWKFGISTAVPVAAGGIAGGISDANLAAPAVAPAAGAPNIAPGPIAGAPGPAIPSMPTYAGGSAIVPRGSFGRGFTLGALGGLTGQDYLSGVQMQPYQSAILQGRINNAGSRDAVNWSQVGLNESRRFTEDSLRDPRVDTERQRGRSYGGLASYRAALTDRVDNLLPYEIETEAGRANTQGALAGKYDEQAETVRQQRPLSLAEIQSRTGENIAQAGAADARTGLYRERTTTEVGERQPRVDVMRARIKNLDARTEATKAQGGGLPTDLKGGSKAFQDAQMRFDNYAAEGRSDAEFRDLFKVIEPTLSPGEAAILKRRLFGE